MKKIAILLIFLFLSFRMALAGHFYPEKYYQNQWCSKWKGKQEVRLYDSTRIDCETKNYVVEFDFAPKWAESVGQSLHYARLTGKKPAIILIIENDNDYKYYYRVKPLCEKYSIALWYIDTKEEKVTQVEHSNYQNCEKILISFVNYLKDFIISII